MPEEQVAWKGYEPGSPEALAATKAYVPPPAIIEEAPDVTVEEVGAEAPPEAPPPTVEEIPPELREPIPVEKPEVVGLEPVIPPPPFRVPYGATDIQYDAKTGQPTEYRIGGELHFTPYNVNWYEGGWTKESDYVEGQKGLRRR